MSKKFFETNFDAVRDRALQEQQNALLEQQNDLLREQQWAAEQAAEEARDKALAEQLFQQGKAKLLELGKYAVERGLGTVYVNPSLGDLTAYSRDITPAVMKPFEDYCGRLAREDRYLNGDDYNISMNVPIKLGVINGIAETHKESFVIVPDNGRLLVHPVSVIREKTGEGYEGKEIAMPPLPRMLFLKPDEVPVVVGMLAEANRAADRAAAAIAASPEINGIDEQLKSLPKIKAVEDNHGFDSTTLLGVIGFLIVCGVVGSLVGSFVDYLRHAEGGVGAGIGLILGVFSAIAFFVHLSVHDRRWNAANKKAKERQDALLQAKREAVARIIAECVSQMKSGGAALEGGAGEEANPAGGA